MTHCFCCQLYHEVVKRQSHEISQLLRSSLLMRQEDVEEFLGPKKANDFTDFSNFIRKRELSKSEFSSNWPGDLPEPLNWIWRTTWQRFQQPQLLKAGKLLFLVDFFPVFSQILPIGVFRGQLDWSSSVSTSWRQWHQFRDVFLHKKMKANLVASLVGFTTRKNGWDFLPDGNDGWWEKVCFFACKFGKKQIRCLRVGVSWRQTKKIIQHFLLTLQTSFTYFFSFFFGSRLFLQNSWRFFLPKFRTKNFSNDASTWPTWWTPVPASCSIGRGPWHFSGEGDCIPRLSKARLLQRKSPGLEKIKMCNNVTECIDIM